MSAKENRVLVELTFPNLEDDPNCPDVAYLTLGLAPSLKFESAFKDAVKGELVFMPISDFYFADGFEHQSKDWTGMLTFNLEHEAVPSVDFTITHLFSGKSYAASLEHIDIDAVLWNAPGMRRAAPLIESRRYA